ncbi:competence/damage-inducible protein A [Fructilactobacillus lindneri]|uniref:Putative competence-damage inducible protein n=1 Tax=Fructilactobacillus lindneri TaxID=53444 RepID=A0AB33BLC0_9LACO|nr:competence/damage-inducible protein A [Fructilactobacillus lindneri]ANZ58339.1 competence/damage-inducible protein A [Fructilactobacillus lindneri]ANZ59661.1 competence/damage-inducible protein A [Fructilactobacillus lindneri]POG98555.1 competence/damage-inducible protein A [Fructilactobacillus lindneri]POH03943.1 competence/damage-inducible protein A [Fructilactobacillus lindneri]POH04814.1 competence/damage-inducible protein A [Fructilactobacillus lindneri]
MNAEIITVGTEILLGEIVDTSAPFVARNLANLGVDVYFQDTVGDNYERLEETISLAEGRSSLVVLTGGLGPTEDDITKLVLAKHLGLNLTTDEKALTKINQFYQSYELGKPANADMMAKYIEGSTVLPNEKGFAVGMFLKTPNCDYLVLPGPPVEMQFMFNKYALPILAKLTHGNAVIDSKVMRFFGIGETELEKDLKPLIDKQTNPTLATYAKRNEVTLRITGSEKTEQDVNSLIDEMVKKVMEIVGQYFYGWGDDNSLAKVVVNLLKEKHLSITAAESLTSGMFQSRIGNISGASEVFPGGFVTYSATAKEQMLEIPTEIVNKYGVVSKETATYMSQNAQSKMKTDIAVSFTGVAGPDELEGHPAGFFWIGLSLPDGEVLTKSVNFAKARNEVRDYATKTGFKMIYDNFK